jgi:long-chain-fatty-acid--[acyl-carrier-protein] ligase
MKLSSKKNTDWKAYLGDFVVAPLIKLILRLRYKITLVGLEEATQGFEQIPGGILFLPNHPAQLDPIIINTYLWKRFRTTAIMLDSYYAIFGLHMLFVLTGAIPLPETLEFMNKWRKKRVEKIYQRILEGLCEDENFLIYPSGKLKSGPKEVIGGTSLIYNLLQDVSHPKVVLVRTKGLWGSQFSKAYTMGDPNVFQSLIRGVKVLFKNGIFFAPKRQVYLEFVKPPADFPYHVALRAQSLSGKLV